MAVLELEPLQEQFRWDEAAGGPTLEDVISGVWEGLSVASPTRCPVCRGALVARWSAGAGVVGGRCRDCGSELA